MFNKKYYLVALTGMRQKTRIIKLSGSAKTCWALAIGTAIIFFFVLGRNYFQDLNYTFAIGTAFLHGRLGLNSASASLNELIPSGHLYYSVFPLGAILSVLPFSYLLYIGLLSSYPVNAVVTLIAVCSVVMSYGVTSLGNFSNWRRAILAVWLVFGSWFFTNMVFAGAWQIALGFAVVGELGAIYFSAVRRRPLLAGIFFAIAVGNRSEIVLTAPIIGAYLIRPEWKDRARKRMEILKNLSLFGVTPVVLLAATAWYNLARFGSAFDFGYAHIPHILKEPWYQHGIFSTYSIPGNAYAMLFQPWHVVSRWPFYFPDPYGGSILLASPFLVLLFRKRLGDRLRYWTAIAAACVLTLVLWLHGNPGGWQFSYRYALELLPWFLLIYIETVPKKITNFEIALFGLSILVNAYATYLFIF